jgi:hypothetical protein
MPPKRADNLKRAQDALEDALNDSPILRKKSKRNLASKMKIPDPVPPPAEVVEAAPEFIDKFQPEAALRLTKANNSLNFSVDKINFYADCLSVFDNERDDLAIALAEKINNKIGKWGAYREKVQKSMDILLKIAPLKKGKVLLDVETAEGFLSSSGQSTIPSSSSRRLASLSGFPHLLSHLIRCSRLRVFSLLSSNLIRFQSPLIGLLALSSDASSGCRSCCLFALLLLSSLICGPRRPFHTSTPQMTMILMRTWRRRMPLGKSE